MTLSAERWARALAAAGRGARSRAVTIGARSSRASLPRRPDLAADLEALLDGATPARGISSSDRCRRNRSNFCSDAADRRDAGADGAARTHRRLARSSARSAAAAWAWSTSPSVPTAISISRSR